VIEDARPAGEGSAPAERENGTPSELARLIGVISESRWLVAGIAAAVLVLGVLYSFVRTPVYEADTVLQVLNNQQASPLGGLEQLSALVQGTPLPTDTEIQLLQTRAVLVPVIEKLHLNIQVGRHGLPVIGALFGSRGKVPADVSVFEVPPALEGDAFTVVPLGSGAYRLLDPDGNSVLEGSVGAAAAGRVQTRGGPAIVNLRIDSIAAGVGHFELARIPADRAVASLLSILQIQEIGQHTGIVRVSLQGISPQFITRAVNLVAETNVRQNVLQNSAQAASQLRFLNAQLPDLVNRFEAAQAKLASYLSTYRTLALSQDAQYLIQQASGLAQQIGPLKAQIAQAQVAYTSQSPQLSLLEAQLHALETQRTDLLTSVAKLPKDQQTLIHLESDVAINQGLYTAMLNQIQALQIAQASTVGGVVIVDPAIVPRAPVLPNRPLDVLVGLVVGLLLGVLAAFVRRLLRHGIEDPEVLDERLGLPVYAVLAHSGRQRRLDRSRPSIAAGVAHLLAAQDEGGETIEGLRSLRTALQLALPASGPRILVIGSLSPAEGKSFVASNLAYLFAQGGLRVLLVDGDLRRGHLHRVFGWPRGKGFAELLRGEAPLEELARATQLEELHVMTTGALPVDAANVLVNADVGALMNRLGALYDLVVVDVPPVLAVSDAFMISRHATLNLLLLKHALHSLRQVRLAQKRFTRHGIKLSGCVMNDVSAAAQRYAYREYGYQYQYRYKPGR